ncbi:MAG: GCN5-related N-acetyltransferase [Francisellaceae bacterium]|nr:GCN5-related N-acetyltransferase [Francisellaceae bacterium]
MAIQNIEVRPLEYEDIKYVNEMRRMNCLIDNTQGLLSDRLESSEKYFNRLTYLDHVLVAELEEGGVKRVVGLAHLQLAQKLRLRHSARIEILVHQDNEKKEVLDRLLKSIIELSDNWLMLIRIELEILKENEQAISFYQDLGFVIEGTRRYAIIHHGKYCDVYHMARYRL